MVFLSLNFMVWVCFGALAVVKFTDPSKCCYYLLINMIYWVLYHSLRCQYLFQSQIFHCFIQEILEEHFRLNLESHSVESIFSNSILIFFLDQQISVISVICWLFRVRYFPLGSVNCASDALILILSGVLNFSVDHFLGFTIYNQSGLVSINELSQFTVVFTCSPSESFGLSLICVAVSFFHSCTEAGELLDELMPIFEKLREREAQARSEFPITVAQRIHTPHTCQVKWFGVWAPVLPTCGWPKGNCVW